MYLNNNMLEIVLVSELFFLKKSGNIEKREKYHNSFNLFLPKLTGVKLAGRMISKDTNMPR